MSAGSTKAITSGAAGSMMWLPLTTRDHAHKLAAILEANFAHTLKPHEPGEPIALIR